MTTDHESQWQTQSDEILSYVSFLSLSNYAPLDKVDWLLFSVKRAVFQLYSVSESMIIVLCQLSNFTAISWQEQINFQWDDDEVTFVLEQHA